MNETRITVHGNVVTDPIAREGRNGSVFTTFRLATTPFKRTGDGKFVDSDTSFYDVIAFNALAANVASALRKGQPVIVEGNLAIKPWSNADGRSGTNAEIDADHVGHDLSWGRAQFERVSRASALGYDRTADPEVRDSLRALDAAAGGGVRSEPLPDHVDANGVVADDYEPSDAEPDIEADIEADIETDTEMGTGPMELVERVGDPDSDDYEVLDRLSA